MKWLFIVGGIVFVGFAAVQVNDPDPIRWMLLYGLVAAGSFAVAFARCPTWFAAATCAVLVVAALYRVPAIAHIREGSLTMKDPGSISDEEVREAGGLLLAASWSVFVLVTARGHTRAVSGKGLEGVRRT